ncbi:uncharacterized protein TRAVEDRAFT_51705 [Trametes versicolor FP-101664 SS1]|uniref:uncharacterized protein n=1 Tax=Trametes versicolor (strain FP-101664) TaxID=717944 RepID=UPI000462489B|nr:uncharacterized protein TRAVEDRAFT_51705 [Trametes versicolor FP-101664 SS1]EIW53967.1 hypothetical protein TRAVEDRAFT_51705 [Trametes versicolor FP-101664 SS1]
MPRTAQKNGRNRAAARRSPKHQSRAKPQDEEEENAEATRLDAVPKGKPKDTKRKTSEAQQRQGPDSKRRETTAEQDSNALISSFQVAQGSTSPPAQHAGEVSPGPSTRPIQPIMLGQWAEATHIDPPKDDRSGLSIQHRRAVQRSLQTASQAPVPRTSTSSLSLALCDPAYPQQSKPSGSIPEQAAPTWSASKSPGDITPPFPTSTNQLETTHEGSLLRGPQPNPFLSQPVARTHPSPSRRAPEQMEHMMERQRMLRQRHVDRDDPRLRQPQFDTGPIPFLGSPTQSIASSSGGLTQAGRFVAVPMGTGLYRENKPTPSWVLQQRASLASLSPVPRPGYLSPRIAGSENRRSGIGSAVRLVQTDTNSQQFRSGETLWPGEPPASMAQPFNQAQYSSGDGSGWVNELRRREAAAREIQWDCTPVASTSASVETTSADTPSGESGDGSVQEWTQRARTPIANTGHADYFEHFMNALIEYEQTSGKTVSPGGLQYSGTMEQPPPQTSYFAQDVGSSQSDMGTHSDSAKETQWAETPGASFAPALAGSNNLALDAHMPTPSCLILEPSSSSLDPSQSLGTDITLASVQEAFARRRAWKPEADMFAGHCWLGFVGEDGFIRSFDPPRPCDGTCESHRILKQGLGEYR